MTQAVQEGPLFGPAGSGQAFEEAKLHSVLDTPAMLARMGLDAYEYQATHGVRITPERAAQLGENARAAGIRLSVHSPYYISLSGAEKEKRDKSVDYLLQSVRAARWMGAERVVVHSGSCAKLPRGQALALAADTLRRTLSAMDAEGLTGVFLCPETMGKLNQLGTVEEVLELCGMDERLLPCVDFGHVNCRTGGGLRTAADFLALLGSMENRLGGWRARHFHAHFSKIEYTAQGEKRHLTFEDERFGPEFRPLAEALCATGCRPVIICESAGTQERDALRMKTLYGELRAAAEEKKEEV
jgi:deoxyribonuclease-4